MTLGRRLPLCDMGAEAGRLAGLARRLIVPLLRDENDRLIDAFSSSTMRFVQRKQTLEKGPFIL